MIRILIASLLALVSTIAAAQLTSSQVVTLKATCQADATCAGYAATADDVALAGWLNATDQSYIVWVTSASIDAIMRNGMDWARVDNLSVGKARIWDWMGRLGTLDCSKPNIRAGIDATWVGTAADLAVRATVYAHCKRSATRAEKALASGTGTDASPATMTYQGMLTYADASAVRS